MIYEELGFDYSRAALELLRHGITYEVLAERMGYRSKASVSAILNGVIPSHRHGEALATVYLEAFGIRPPNVQKNEQHSINPSV